MRRPIYLRGAAMTAFGRHDASPHDLARSAILDAVKDAGLELAGVQARASGVTGVHLACHALQAGIHDTVVVFGAGRQTLAADAAAPQRGNDAHEPDGPARTARYAMHAARYLREFNVDAQVLGEVVVKNRCHGALNPLAQNRQPVTIDEVMGSPVVYDPLTQLQCCSWQVDGAAALVLSTQRPQGRAMPVRVLASAVQSGRLASGCDDILGAGTTARAARRAYEQAGVMPADIDLVELHDTFSIAELTYYEALGLCGRGEAHELLRSGATTLGGGVPVNPSGGLLAKGHPPAATGVAQLVELAWQLEGRAGERQVTGAALALAQCVESGAAGVDQATAAVHILGF